MDTALTPAIAKRLHRFVAAVCPIDGIAILDSELHQARVDYQAVATAEQIAAAQEVVNGFDWSDDAQRRWDAQTRAGAFAKDPMVQYLLGQIKEAVPGYAIPEKDSIATSPALLDAIGGDK